MVEEMWHREEEGDPSYVAEPKSVRGGLERLCRPHSDSRASNARRSGPKRDPWC